MNCSMSIFSVCVTTMMLSFPNYLFSQEKNSDNVVSDNCLSLQDLLNIKVTTVSKSAEKQSDAPGIISVITKDELKRFGGTTLKDVLDRVPGVISMVGGSGTNRSSIFIRGDNIKQTSSHTLILLNGRPVREVQEGGLSADILNGFPVNSIEQIEVIKGPGSVLYGSDAFSGVINIITSNADKNKASFTQFYQANGGLKSAGEGFAKIGDLEVVVAGQYYQNSVWNAPYYPAVLFVNHPPFFLPPNGDTLINVPIPDTGRGLFFGINYKKFRLNGTYDDFCTDDLLQLTVTKNSKYFTNAGYTQTVNDKWNMDFNFSFCQTEFSGQDYMKRRTHNFVGEWTNFLKLSDKANAAIGGSFNRIDGKEILIQFLPYDTLCDGSLSAYAAYAQFDYQLVKYLKCIAGLQLNKVGHLDVALVPRIGFISYPIEDVSVKALYSEAYRAPSINELYMNYYPYMVGNADLKPEKISTCDFEISYQGEKIRIALNAFYSRQKDIIRPVYFNMTTLGRQYQNIDKVVNKGGELEARYYMNRNIYMNASMLYQTNRSGAAYNLSPMANFGAKAGISYESDKGVTVSLFNIYQGDLDDKFKKGLNPDQGAYNLLHLHSEFQLNTLLNSFKRPGLSLLFNVDDILDKKVYAYDWGGITNSSIPAIPGRALYLGLKVDLE